MRRPNHASRFEGIAKTKLQASRASDTETLQSQVNKAAEKRLSLSGLEILHGRLLKQNENRRDGAATGPWSYLVVRSRGSGRAGSPHSRRARCPKFVGCRQVRGDRFRSYR